MRLLAALVLPLLLVPPWTGDARLDLPAASGPTRVTAEPVPLESGDSGVRRVGRLTYLGGAVLSGRDRAFGGFSALTVKGDRFALVSDGGNVLSFRMGPDWHPCDIRYRPLPGGPGTGWEKGDRDSESVAVDPRTGALYVGFERYNAVIRYAPDFSRILSAREPRQMARWADNGGPESMVATRDGRVLVLQEENWNGGATRQGLIFPGDPTRPVRASLFRYRPAPGFDPSDATELPDGRLAVLERRFRPPFRFVSRVAIVSRGAVRPGTTVTGETAAVLEAPRVHDNFEGIAAARENGQTVLWLVSDNNQMPALLQRSLLLKFRLD